MATLMGELAQLCRELDDRRTLALDLAAWFEKHPDQSESFGEFQETCAAARARLKQQAVALVVNKKRRARR